MAKIFRSTVEGGFPPTDSQDMMVLDGGNLYLPVNGKWVAVLAYSTDGGQETNPAAVEDTNTDGSILAVTKSSHGFVVGDVLYFNGTVWAKARANAQATLGYGVVSAVPNSGQFVITFLGVVSGLSSLTPGTWYYTSESSAGALSSSEGASFSNPIGVALSATTLLVLPFRGSSTA